MRARSTLVIANGQREPDDFDLHVYLVFIFGNRPRASLSGQYGCGARRNKIKKQLHFDSSAEFIAYIMRRPNYNPRPIASNQIHYMSRFRIVALSRLWPLAATTIEFAHGDHSGHVTWTAQLDQVLVRSPSLTLTWLFDYTTYIQVCGQLGLRAQTLGAGTILAPRLAFILQL